MIPVFKPSMDKEEIKAVAEVIHSGWIGAGPKVELFEKKLAEYVRAPYTVAVNCASAALYLAMKVADVKPGDEVISPSLTFVATNHTIILNQGRIVFADIDPQTLCADPSDILKKISKKTKAIMLVHYGGHPVDLDPLIEICQRKKIVLIEDAAHAMGTEYKGKKIGGLSDFTCFSFAAIKNLSCGDGGAITTKSKKIKKELEMLRWSGISRETWRRQKNEKYFWKYGVKKPSLKYQMNDISAAIGLVQLKKLEKNNAKRRAITETYNQAFQDLKWLETPIVKPWAKSSYHNYVIKVPSKSRNRLIGYLSEKGISTTVHYYPNHYYKIYRQFSAHVPITEKIWQKIVLLPIFPDLTASQQKQVIEAVKAFKP